MAEYIVGYTWGCLMSLDERPASGTAAHTLLNQTIGKGGLAARRWSFLKLLFIQQIRIHLLVGAAPILSACYFLDDRLVSCVVVVRHVCQGSTEGGQNNHSLGSIPSLPHTTVSTMTACPFSRVCLSERRQWRTHFIHDKRVTIITVEYIRTASMSFV